MLKSLNRLFTVYLCEQQMLYDYQIINLIPLKTRTSKISHICFANKMNVYKDKGKSYFWNFEINLEKDYLKKLETVWCVEIYISFDKKKNEFKSKKFLLHVFV